MSKIVCTVINDLNYDQRMRRICSSLSHAGHEVLLVGRRLNNSRPLKKESYQQKRMKCFFNKGFLFYAEYNIRLFLFLIFHTSDIVCAVDLDTLWAGTAAALIRKRKLVYDAHEYFTEVPELEGRKCIKKVWDFIAKKCIPMTDLRYTVSACLSEELERKYKKAFHYIRNVPARQKNLRDNKAIKKNFLLYQGALNKGRGLEILLEAMQDIPMDIVLAGEGDLSRELRIMTRKLMIEEKVKFTGMLSLKELNAITPRAFLGYNLLDPGSKSYYYSLANKFFAYMHAGIPILGNKFPEYLSVNEKFNICVFCEYSKESIIKAVYQLSDDLEKWKMMKENCIKASFFYNWEKEEKKLVKLYDGIR
jgi:glycosyltransferase involved in cell wall biosynthesis